MKPSITSVFTRSQANNGITVPLLKNALGEPTGIELTILGTDSDVFQVARSERSRESARILAEVPKSEQAAAIKTADIKLLSVLVVGWNCEEELTQANVIKLLTESPAAYELVDTTAGNRALFLPKKSED